MLQFEFMKKGTALDCPLAKVGLEWIGRGCHLLTEGCGDEAKKGVAIRGTCVMHVRLHLYAQGTQERRCK